MAEQEERRRSLLELVEALGESPRQVGYHWRVLQAGGMLP
jgi:DNA-binding transcriptional ArsR family regulator